MPNNNVYVNSFPIILRRIYLVNLQCLAFSTLTHKISQAARLYRHSWTNSSQQNYLSVKTDNANCTDVRHVTTVLFINLTHQTLPFANKKSCINPPSHGHHLAKLSELIINTFFLDNYTWGGLALFKQMQFGASKNTLF